MMKGVFSCIQSFYNRFSYSAKMRFVGVFCTASALPVFGMLYYVQYPLLKIVESKTSAFNQYLPLNALLEMSCNLEVFLSKNRGKTLNEAELEPMIRAVDNKLDEIRDTMQPSLKENAFVSPGNIREIGHLLEKVTQQWEGAKKEYQASGRFPLHGVIALSEDIVELIKFNMVAHRLHLSLIMSLYLLTDITLNRIPTMQVLIADIIVRRSTLENSPENINQRARLNEKFLGLKQLLVIVRDEVGQTKKSQSRLLRNDDETNRQVFFAAYQNAIGIYLDNLGDDKVSIPELADLASVALKKGWEFDKEMQNVVYTDLNYGLNLLRFRQNVALAIVGIGLLTFIGMYLTRVNRRPLEDLKSAANMFSKGDLTVRVPITSHDEVATIGIAFNEMAERCEESIKNTGALITRLVKTAGGIVDIAKQLEANIKSQEKAIFRMKIQAKEIAKVTHRLKDLLQEVNKSVGVTSNLASLGKSTLVEMETIMKQIMESSKLIVYTLAAIKEQVIKINGVLVTIVTIADQSNLLSLNTAIKANKTGRKGIGFSVVADKIRELADQTANTTLEVEESVSDIVTAVSDAVTDVDNFSVLITGQVEDEKKINDDLSKRINETQTQIEIFANIIENMEERLQETLQIDELIANLSTVTEEAGNSVHKLFHDAAFLHRSTRDLDTMIALFKTTK